MKTGGKKYTCTVKTSLSALVVGALGGVKRSQNLVLPGQLFLCVALN